MTIALQCLEVARAALGEPLRQTGQELFFRCPNPTHNDQHPSLQVNQQKNVWMCGPCAASGNAWQLAAFIGGLDPNEKADLVCWLEDHELSNSHNSSGLTLSAYAKSKHLPEDFLRSLGLQDARHANKPALLIPYNDLAGKPAAFRLRLSMTGPRSEKFRWKKGTTTLPYGLSFLPAARRMGCVTLVEGESDCHTLWYHDIPAIGIPGAGTWQDQWGEFLKDISVIYALIEPDRGGETFRNKLLSSPICSRLRFMRLEGVKDPSELYLRDPDRFKQIWDSAMTAATVPPKVDIASVLREIVQFIRRFVALTESQAHVIALWVLHTYTFDVADATPYLSISSPEKQSGKTRLLEVLDVLVANPWLTCRVSVAVLVRKIAAEHLTLLLDESDAAFKGPEEYSEALRGILNSGHRRGGKTSLCVGHGANIRPEDFPTFSPKAIAGIGTLPDTVADRSIPIRLKRRSGNEKVERFRGRITPAEARPIRNRLAAWAGASIDALRQAAPPSLPEALSDRQQDGAEPLIMIADLAGGEWPQVGRCALVELCSGATGRDASIGALLLSDIRHILEAPSADRIASVDLAVTLAKIETSPWGEWKRDNKPITPIAVAHLLKPFGIGPHPIRDGIRVFRGYERSDFADAWSRYLGPDDTLAGLPNPGNVAVLQAASGVSSSNFRAVTHPTAVAPQNVREPTSNGLCNTVTLPIPQRDTMEDL